MALRYQRQRVGRAQPEHVSWQGEIGLWRKTHKGGTTRFDLVQRSDGEMRVFYGVTEDGIHGAWRRLVEAEDRRTPEALAAAAEAPAPAGEATDFAEPLAPEPVAIAEDAVAEMVADEQQGVAEMAAVPRPEAVPPIEGAPEPVGMASAEPPAKRRSRGGRSTKKTASKSAKTPAASRPTRKTTKAKPASPAVPALGARLKPPNSQVGARPRVAIGQGVLRPPAQFCSGGRHTRFAVLRR